MHTQVYLFFDGRCDEALDFYKKNLGIEVEMLMRFKDAPKQNEAMCTPGNENKVMHSCFKLSDWRVRWPPTAAARASRPSKASHCRSQ
jgi:PhnB protein